MSGDLVRPGQTKQSMRPQDYDYDLPPEQIAQKPADTRAGSRLLVVRPGGDAEGGFLEHTPADLPALLGEMFPQGYLLVVNDSKVVPARFFLQREDGRLFELLVTAPAEGMGPGAEFFAWVKNAKRLRDQDLLRGEGLEIRFEADPKPSSLDSEVAAPIPTDRASVPPAEGSLSRPKPAVASDRLDPRARRFVIQSGNLMEFLARKGQVPLPPYIRREDAPGKDDNLRYQTVYAQNPGSVAAPTAGLHLDAELLQKLSPVAITLHVGPGTFLPMEAEDVRDHRVGAERVEVSPQAAAAIETARAAKKAIVAVGTTVTRTLEGLAARHDGRIVSGTTQIDLVIAPGHRFLVVAGLLTNFHLPRSSLLMLTCTFGGQERVLQAYRQAVSEGFRFYSYGDCMLLEGGQSAQASQTFHPPQTVSLGYAQQDNKGSRATQNNPCDSSIPPTPADYFEIVAQDDTFAARAATLKTAHGQINTPCFMPVGTYGAVKGLIPSELWDCGSQIILGNAYHLGHRPGAQAIAQMGGLHGMMAWSGPILTDSGGYQVFSLRGLQKIDDEGVDYRTHFDGQKSRMTPRSVLEVQAALGSDICMILDHCPPGDATREAMQAAMDRTTRWAKAASDMRREILGAGQLCFGIVQGGTDESLRRQHLEAISALDFDGVALGGLSVGEPIPDMHRTFHAIAPHMPKDRPRYIMGIGTPHDLLEAVCSGIDVFDCVMPTRHARNGQLFTWEGKLNIRRSEMRHDLRPVDAKCNCLTCTTFSRAYLRHLHSNNDPLYTRLATLHNLTFYHDWVGGLRGALRRGDFPAQVQRYREILRRGYGVNDFQGAKL